MIKALEHDYHNETLLAEQSHLVTFLDLHDAWSLDEKIEQVLQEFTVFKILLIIGK